MLVSLKYSTSKRETSVFLRKSGRKGEMDCKGTFCLSLCILTYKLKKLTQTYRQTYIDTDTDTDKDIDLDANTYTEMDGDIDRDPYFHDNHLP